MRSIRVIPCLDIKDGRVVKGVNFVGLRDAGDPIELAKFYDKEGADELVFLDITASFEARPPIVELASRVAECVFIPFTVGGGIRNTETIRETLKAGADKVSLNTAAIQNPSLLTEGANLFGAQCIVIAIDAKKVGDHWEVFTHGGRNNTGLNAVEWAIEAVRRGAGEILLTSMDGDGSRKGYDLELTRAISEAVEVPVIASGGAGVPQDLTDAVRIGRADAVLVAGIVHDGVYSLSQLKESMHDSGIPVRIT